jgi:apolipoprotein D and lipocalin family protein
MTATVAPHEVKSVDLDRYSGKWYVIACIPTRYDKDWNYTTETYSVAAKGSIDILTTYKKGDHHEERSTRSKGFPVKESNNVRWKVQFVWPFKTDYQIEELSPDYTTVVVGHPQKKFLYIMNRSGRINAIQYEQILERMVKKGYNTAQLRKVEQGF